MSPVSNRSLEGRVALVTGGSSGQGFASARALSQEVAADSVTINAVLPGYTLTERQDELADAASARTGKPREEVVAGWIGNTPMGRMAEPDELGAMVGFLCSPEASYVTGQAVAVDGGYIRGL